MIKNPPAMQETRVLSLGWEDPLEKRMVTYSSILAWRITWIEDRELFEQEPYSFFSSFVEQFWQIKLVCI